jgi:hypothetical protein
LNATLYIIGNGFDLHHGIPSSYKAFGQFLEREDKETFRFVDRYFSVDADFWSEFEERLASLDTDTLIDDVSQFLVSYGADDWSDAYHHDYQYEITRVVEAISKTMRARFGDWIRQVRIPEPSAIGPLSLPVDPEATFLNFNYTASLQRLYSVPSAHILHIHGAASDATEQLVLGHGRRPEENLDRYRFESDPKAADMRVVEGVGIVDDYFKETFKPTERIIRKNCAFFEGLAGIERILVMGHSLAEVDYPYFHKVVRHIDRSRVRWKISYRDDLDVKQARFLDLGVDLSLAEFLPLDKF